MAKKTFSVECILKQSWSTNFDIEAETEEEARRIAETQHENNELIFEDLSDEEFEIEIEPERTTNKEAELSLDDIKDAP